MEEKMSERRMREGISLFINSVPFVLFSIVTATIFLLVLSGFSALIVSVCWNVTVTEMFNLPKSTFLQAWAIMFMLGCFSRLYFDEIWNTYYDIRDDILYQCKNERHSDIIAFFPTLLFVIIRISISIFVMMYTWNSVFPELIGKEINQISVKEAFGLFLLIEQFLFYSKLKTKDEKRTR